MGIWSSGYMHMYACERQIEEREGEGERRENAIPDYMCLCCSVGGHVLEEARERREQRLRKECGDDGDSARQRAREPMCLTLRGIIMWKHQ